MSNHTIVVTGFVELEWSLLSELEHRMSMVHGFFVSMGGFVKMRDNKPHPVASHEIGYDVSVKTILDVKVGEIEDRSKGDELSKGFAFFQTSWFIVQCIARGHQHLPLTELEIVTLAFAALNIVIRLVWWKKPLDVRYPITIMAKGDTSASSNARADSAPTGSREDKAHRKPDLDMTAKIEPPASPTPVHRRDPESGAQGNKSRFLRWHKALIRGCDDFVDIILMIFEGEEDDAYIRKSATRVPTLWAGRLDGWQRGTAATIGIVLAMGFGAIHFTAWNASFPSEPERLLWQVAAILLVAVPFLFFLGAAAVLKKGRIHKPYYAIIFNGIVPLGVFTYVVARAILVVLPFISLRSLPPGAYKDVDWDHYIPHIG